MWRLHPRTLAGAAWAAFAARVVRARLTTDGVKARVPHPPKFVARAGRGVRAALNHLNPTCLERALVLQAWLEAQGIRRDIVIGVLPGGLKDGPAHAWVEGADEISPTQYLELHRVKPGASGGQ